MATAKQAGVGKFLGQMGKSMRIAAKKTGRGIKKVGPSAVAGAAGGAAGYSFGHGRGYDKGHGEGYSTGSREGGSNAMRNLVKGLMDVQRAGGTSKVDLQKELNLGEMKKAAVKIHRTKLARHVLRLHALQQAISVYDAAGLRKAAAVGTHKDERVKYAQLQLQYYTEKRAFLGALARGAGLLGKGIRAGAGILGQMGRGVGQAARAGAQQFGKDVMPHLRQAGQAGMGVLQNTAGQMGSAIGSGVDKGTQLGRIAGKQMQRAAQPMLGRMQQAGANARTAVSNTMKSPAAVAGVGAGAGLLGGYAAGQQSRQQAQPPANGPQATAAPPMPAPLQPSPPKPVGGMWPSH